MFDFQKIYLINLPHRIDRLMSAKEQAKKYGFEFEVFAGIYGIDFRTKYPEQNNNTNGCSASHLQIYQRAKILGLNNYMVLEDDFQINPDIADIFPKVMQDLPTDWDMLYFGASHQQIPERITSNIYKLKRSLTTHAYAVNLDNRFSEIISKFDFSNTMDGVYADAHKDYNCYISNPPLVWQKDDYSDIEGRVMSYNWIKQGI